jgi:hypothetical protein
MKPGNRHPERNKAKLVTESPASDRKLIPSAPSLKFADNIGQASRESRRRFWSNGKAWVLDCSG